jgi:hypothetical protein
MFLSPPTNPRVENLLGPALSPSVSHGVARLSVEVLSGLEDTQLTLSLLSRASTHPEEEPANPTALKGQGLLSLGRRRISKHTGI